MIYFLFNLYSGLILFSKFKNYLLLKIFLFISLLFFLGFRYGWGLDFNEYFKDFYQIRNSYSGVYSIIDNTWEKILNQELTGLAGREPLYLILMILSSKFSTTVLGFNILSQGIILTNFYIFCQKTKNFWLSMTLSLPFLIFLGTDMVRQFLAISFLLASISFYLDKKMLFATIYIIVTPLFHLPAAMFLSLLIFYYFDKKWIVRIFSLSIAAYLLIYVYTNKFLFLNRFLFYSSIERLGTYEIELGDNSKFLYFLISSLTIFIMFFYNHLLNKKIFNTEEERKIFIFFVILYGLTAFLLVFASIAGFRMSLYLIPFCILYLTKIVDFTPQHKYSFNFILMSSSMLLVFLWLNFSNGRYVYLPYKNMMFDPIIYNKSFKLNDINKTYK